MSKMFQVYGIGQALIPVLPPPLLFENAPNSNQTNYEVGQVVYTGVPGSYTFYIYAGAGVWELLDVSTGVLDTLTTDDNTVVVPTAGNINLKGSGSTTTVGSGSNATVELTGLTNHAVLVGAGTTTITKLALGTNGQVLTGATGADPAFAALGVNSGLTAHGVVLGEGNSALAATAAGTNGQVLLGSTGADPAFGTLTTSTGVAFTGGAAALAVDLKQGGYKINAASTGATIAVQNSYTVTQAGQTSFALPATAAVGDMFLIAGSSGNTGGLKITQASGQTIRQNTNASTTGATGNVATAAANTSFWVMCVVANTDFIILASVGTVTFT